MTKLRLEVVQPGVGTCVIEPDGDIVRLGRSPSSDVCIDDPAVASHHARIVVDEEAISLEDLDTGASTAVRRGKDRTALGGDISRFALEGGDVIELGHAQQSWSARGDPRPFRRQSWQSRASSKCGPWRSCLALLPDAGIRCCRTICEVQQDIGAATDLAGVLRAVADAGLILVPRATHATVMLKDEATSGGSFVPVVTRVRGPLGKGVTPSEALRVASSVFRKVVRERVAVLAADAPSGELSSESLLGASIRSTIGVPLWQREEIVGVLQIDNRAMPGMFTSADVDAMSVLAAIASLAVAKARLIHRLELTEEQLERENRFLKGRERTRRGTAEVVGASAAFAELMAQIGKVADTRVSVLIEGETGSGKELLAAALHYRSRRRERLFVAQNCAALPENLLESELFGHKRGAFTGATEDRKGLFELADRGTLFLDEVTETPLALQAKLLRVLQEGEVRPVGASHPKHVDVRIIAATNRNLEKEVAEGRFREDLYYRLKVFPLRVPPLRERREDVPLLAHHFLTRYSAEMGKVVAGYTDPAMALMVAHGWPGNVRELENEVQRLVIQVEPNGFVTPELLSAKIRQVEGTVIGAGVPRTEASEKDDGSGGASPRFRGAPGSRQQQDERRQNPRHHARRPAQETEATRHRVNQSAETAARTSATCFSGRRPGTHERSCRPSR